MHISFTDDDLNHLSHVNNIPNSLFSNCEVYLNNQKMNNSNGLNGHNELFSLNLMFS